MLTIYYYQNLSNLSNNFSRVSIYPCFFKPQKVRQTSNIKIFISKNYTWFLSIRTFETIQNLWKITWKLYKELKVTKVRQFLINVARQQRSKYERQGLTFRRGGSGQPRRQFKTQSRLKHGILKVGSVATDRQGLGTIHVLCKMG